MDEYYDKTWEYGKFLEKGWGTIVSNEFKRPLNKNKKITFLAVSNLSSSLPSIIKMIPCVPTQN